MVVVNRLQNPRFQLIQMISKWPWLTNWPELISATRMRGATCKNVSIFAGNKLGWIRLA